MKVKPANIAIRKSFAQTTRGTIIPIYFATYQGLLLGDWVHLEGDKFFFSLPNGKILYRGVQTKALVFREPKPRLDKRMALVRFRDLRKATVVLLKRGVI